MGGKKNFLSLFQKEEIHCVCECRIRDSLYNRHASLSPTSIPSLLRTSKQMFGKVLFMNEMFFDVRWLQFR